MKALVVILMTLLFLQRGEAVILYGLDNAANTTYASLDAAGFGDVPWQNVARIGGVESTAANGTGIYLGNGFVLTANHVQPQDTPKIEINGAPYDFDPGYAPRQVAAGVDLKIFKIQGGPILDPVDLYSGSSEVGSQTTVMIGWGQGRGSEIVGQGWNWGGDPTNNVRWGTNQVEWSGTFSGYQALATWFSADQGNTEYSATLRDSGSPIFQMHNGRWQLVGITTSVEVMNQSLYNPQQYTVTVRISEYQDEILAIIPEPSISILLASALPIIAALRRRKGASFCAH